MQNSEHSGLERGRPLVADRRRRLSRLVGRSLDPPAASGDLSADRRAFLLEEAQELYWNELSWEQVTSEEGIGESGLVEFTFPGFLAFIEGLLLREVMPDSLAPASPRPEVVEDVLLFLATRWLELAESDEPEAEIEAQVTARLIDLVLYRLHDVDVEEVERLEEETPNPDGD